MKILRIIFKDRGLWYKLMLPSVLPVMLVIIIIFIALIGSFERVMIREEEGRADSLVNLTRLSMSHGFVIYNKELLDNLVDGLGKIDEVSSALIVDSADNRVLAHSDHAFDGNLLSELPEKIRSALEISDNKVLASGSEKNGLLYTKSAPVIIDGKEYATIHIVFSFDKVQKKLLSFKQKVIFISIIAILTGIALAFLAAKKISSPIHKLAAHAELTGKGNFNYSLQYDGKDAIGQLVDAFNQMFEKIKTKQTQLTAINRIADIVYSTLDINTVARRAVKAMMDYSKSTAVAFFLLNNEKSQLDLLFSDGFSENTLKKAATLPLEGSLTGRTINEKQVLFSTDIVSDQRVENGVRDALMQENMVSVYSVPILARDEVLGAMNLIHKTSLTIDELEKETLMSIGKTIGLAMSNAIQVAQIQKEIKERMEAETALRENELKYRNVVERANDGIIILQDGIIRYANPSIIELSGQDEKDFVGQPFSAYLHPDAKENIVDFYNRRLTGDLLDNIYETILLRKDGQEIYAEVNAGRITFEDKPADLVIIRDITERKRAQEELRKAYDLLEIKVAERTSELAIAKDRAEEADRLKSAFLASMSHELRTPLNSIIGFTGIILQKLVGPLNDEQAKQLNMVQESAQHLLSLINDVLDLSKIEAGQLNVASEKVDMADVISKVIKAVQPMASKKGLQLECTIPESIPVVMSDKRRVEQILLNLVNNSIKFTEKGGVKIMCRAEERRIITEVIDTGIGIAAEDMDKLFRAFQQIETGLSRKYEGTGLGLSICRKLAGLLGGEISAASDGPGKGAKFTCILPLREK
ncbi:MAG: PAS domain S-box protein [Deltaproteobacteria bacterium]|nr:PAS domain S-box protein [Deltaproteobacteria bacterium]